MKRFFLFSLLLVVVSTSVHAGKVYKWTDENGQVQYSNFPPAKVEAEKVRVPTQSESSTERSSSYKATVKFKTKRQSKKSARKAEERKKKREQAKKKRAAKNYDRKYGAEARLKKLEQEKRQKQAHADRVHRERIRRIENEKKSREFDKKMDKYKQKVMGLEGDCKAAHGTDCTNPEYLKKWVRKKYESKK